MKLSKCDAIGTIQNEIVFFQKKFQSEKLASMKNLQSNRLLVGISRWILIMFDWFIRKLYILRTQNQCKAKWNCTNWVTDSILYTVHCTHSIGTQALSIQAIKLVRLIYWAWIQKKKKRQYSGSCIYPSCITHIQDWRTLCALYYIQRRCLSYMLLITCYVLCIVSKDVLFSFYKTGDNIDMDLFDAKTKKKKKLYTHTNIKHTNKHSNK